MKGFPKNSTDQAKEAAGLAAAGLILDDMLVGLGTGSTAYHFIRQLGQRCSQGLKVRCVASSLASWQLGKQSGLTMIDIDGLTEVDVTVDGADEIDHSKNMIKGGGGALLREKILANMSREMIVVVDTSKVVDYLGSFPLPIEVVTFGFDATLSRIRKLDFVGSCRLKSSGDPFLTDGGNRIIDIDLTGEERDHHAINSLLKSLPGVVETGFFFGLAGRVIIGKPDGTIERWE